MNDFEYLENIDKHMTRVLKHLQEKEQKEHFKNRQIKTKATSNCRYNVRKYKQGGADIESYQFTTGQQCSVIDSIEEAGCRVQ